MTIHIAAQQGQIADTVLLPGDPLRAKLIAETWLKDVVCYSQVRGMLGFTGTFQGKRISVQGTGMGLPSMSIYANELIDTYGVKRLVRVGSCGSLQSRVALGDIVMGQSACCESNVNQRVFRGMDFAPVADFSLLSAAYTFARAQGITAHVGSILSADQFYATDPEEWKLWASHGVLAVEMETSALYTIAARKGVRALSLLTVSDSLVTGEQTTAHERERYIGDMVRIALEGALLNT